MSDTVESQGRSTAQRYGGSFAPPLSAEKLARYREISSSASPEIREVMLKLCDMVERFQETPASKLPHRAHPSGMGRIVSLEPKEIERIDEVVPWMYECDAYQRLFETLPTGVNAGPLELVERKADGNTQALTAVPGTDARGKFSGDSGSVFFSKPRNVVVDAAQKELRDACFHLVWFAKELTMDREPMTNDMI